MHPQGQRVCRSYLCSSATSVDSGLFRWPSRCLVHMGAQQAEFWPEGCLHRACGGDVTCAPAAPRELSVGKGRGNKPRGNRTNWMAMTE